MARNAQVVRQWRLLRHLSKNPRGCQAEELARVLRAPLRSIYRDLRALEDAGFPIWSQYVGRMFAVVRRCVVAKRI